jgi:putative membrane protein
MPTISLIFMTMAGLVHIGFFVIESLLWRRPEVHKIFGVRTTEEAETMAFALFNQGFYNLFLGLGALFGVAGSAWLFDNDDKLVVFCALFMVGAAIVLVAGNRRLWRGAVVQGALPGLALLAALVF